MSFISEFFNQPIEVTDISNQQKKSGYDYNLIFDVPTLQLYVEVYYLKMRKKGWEGEDMYITEIIYDFDKKDLVN